mmetsp:Transcript_8672/g.22097  ORF Transcript_8672/g.22097 Transcript_8672/m.22097 type:complete len:206 (-) Transcript_8672:331-948(-)
MSSHSHIVQQYTSAGRALFNSPVSRLVTAVRLAAPLATRTALRERLGRAGGRASSPSEGILRACITERAVGAVAVAVSARMQLTPSSSLNTRPSFRNDGRKWWPHCDTQCASSTHANEIRVERIAEAKAGHVKRSGATYSTLGREPLGASGCSEASTANFSASVWVEVSFAPNSSCGNLCSWSSMSASNGEITNTISSAKSAGSW